MSKAKKATGRPRGRPKGSGKVKNTADQQHLPGVEPEPKIPDIHQAALNYARESNARIRQNAEEKEAKNHLIAMMHKHEKQTYAHGNIAVVLTNKEDLKVTTESGETSSTD